MCSTLLGIDKREHALGFESSTALYECVLKGFNLIYFVSNNTDNLVVAL